MRKRFQRGFVPLVVLVVVAITGTIVVGGSVVVERIVSPSRVAIDVEQAIKASPFYLDKHKIRGGVVEGDILGTVLLSDGSFSSYKVIDGTIAERRYQGEVRIAYLSGDYALGNFHDVTIDPFILRDGTKDTAVIVDRVVAKLILPNGQSLALKIVEGQVRAGKLIGVFKAQTFSSGHIIVGQLDSESTLIAGSVIVGSEKASEAQTIIASEALGLYQKLAQSSGSRVLGVTSGLEVSGIEGGPVPLYDEKKGTWSFGGAIVTPSTNLVSNLTTYVQQSIPSQIESQLQAFVATGTSGDTIITGISEIESDSARLSVSTINNIATLSLDLAGITADISKDSVKTEHIKNGEVKAEDIKDNDLNTSELSQTLTFSDGDFIDLAGIIHDDTSPQGLRLPNASSATPTSPSSGEGYIAYDTSGNQVIFYNGSSWGSVGSGDITAVTAGNGLSGGATSGDASLAVSLTTSGTTGSTSSNSGLEVSSSGLTLLKGCTDNEILKYTDAGGWVCASDSSGSGSTTVEEGDSTVDATVTNFDFLAADFIIGETPEDEVNISIDYTNSKIVRSDQTESITGGWSFANLTISDTNVPLTGASLTFDFNNASDRTLTIANSGDGTANFAVDGTISQGGSTLAATYAPIDANFVTVTANGTLTGETGIDALSTAISTSSTLNVDGASTLAAVTLDANANLTLSSGTGSIIVTNAVTNASDEVIDINPSFTGGATDILVYSVIDIAAFTADNGVGTDTVKGGFHWKSNRIWSRSYHFHSHNHWYWLGQRH